MFCTQCGTQNDDGAKFCAKCGAALKNVTETSEVEKNQTKKAEEMKGKKKSPWKWILILLIVIAIIWIWPKGNANSGTEDEDVSVTITSTSNKTEKPAEREEEPLPAWVEQNKGKGAENPEDIIDAYMNALAEHDSNYIAKYWDAAAGASDRGCVLYRSDDLDDNLYDHITEIKNSGCDQMYLKAGYDYSIAEDTQRDLYSVKAYEVDYYEKGLIGKGSQFVTYLYFHSNLTPDGIRWFVGKARQYTELPEIYNDPTGTK